MPHLTSSNDPLRSTRRHRCALHASAQEYSAPQTCAACVHSGIPEDGNGHEGLLPPLNYPVDSLHVHMTAEHLGKSVKLPLKLKFSVRTYE